MYQERVKTGLTELKRKDGWVYSTIFLDGIKKKFEKLPVSCIESAQHIIRCHSRGSFSPWPIDNPIFTVKVKNDGRIAYDIDESELHSITGRYGYSGKPSVGEGLVLINKKYPKPLGEWTCHAVGIVASNGTTGEFVVIDIYADDSAARIVSNSSWTMSYFKTTGDFYEQYKRSVGGASHCLLALLAIA